MEKRCPECGSDDLEEIGCLQCTDADHLIDGEPCPYCDGTGAYYECYVCGTMFAPAPAPRTSHGAGGGGG